MAFNLPLQNYFSRTTGPAAYSRPACWPVITDVATEVQFLFCDLGDAACQIRTFFTRTSGVQNIVIDWGDGFTDTVTNSFTTNTTHIYTPGTGTPCPSLGYTTFIIRVYFTGTGVSVLNNCNIMPNVISGNVSSNQPCAVLEAYYGDSTQNATPVNFFSQGSNTTSLGVYTYLQFVKLPATVTWNTWGSTFYNCISLLKVVMPTSNSAATSYQSAFSGCYNLLEITIPSNSTGITSFIGTFFQCYNLRSVTLPPTLNSCSSFQQVFYLCANLRSVTIPSINTCNSFNVAFIACNQLEWVKFTSMPTVVGTIDFGSAFSSCANLQNIYFPATGTAGSIYNFNSTFANCNQLKSIVFPSNINVSSFSSTFSGCYALGSCILPTNAAACTSYSSIFNSCISLLKITLPTAPTATVSLNSAFSGCTKLEEITIPPGYVISDMSSICSNSNSIKTFTWTPGVQNSLTTLSTAFSNCYLLTSITMPSSMNVLTNLTSAFTNCRSLLSITFPSTLNAVTSLNATFTSCTLLNSVTLPTSMSACNVFTNTFQDCPSLTSITFPNVVSTNTTSFSVCFFQCFNLRTCVFPGAAQLSLVNNINSMFYLCSNLTTITNFDKLGSLTATPLIAASINFNRFAGGSALSFYGPLSQLLLQGMQSNMKVDVQAVRLFNTSAGQWTGTSPQINVSNTNMSTAQIVQLFNDMALQGNVVSKTINITTATGTAALTTADRLIVTSKGWTIIG